MTRTVLVWAAFAIAGLAFAVGIGIAAAEISSERIGLSSEPLSAGEDLAPPVRRGVGASDRTPKEPAPPTEDQIDAREEARDEAREAAEEAREAAERALDEADEDD